jgi:hypothetical protein
MTRYAKELEQRIERGDPLEDTRKWFLGVIGNVEFADVEFADLAPNEQVFMFDLVVGSRVWQLGQEDPTDEAYEGNVKEALSYARRTLLKGFDNELAGARFRPVYYKWFGVADIKH